MAIKCAGPKLKLYHSPSELPGMHAETGFVVTEVTEIQTNETHGVDIGVDNKSVLLLYSCVL